MEELEKNEINNENNNNENEKEKSKKICNDIISTTISYTIAVIIACTFFLLGDLFFRYIKWGHTHIPTKSLYFAIPFGVIIFTLITAITKKSSRATIICNITTAIIVLISSLKVTFTGEPLYFSDINFIGKSSDLVKLIVENVDDSFVFWMIMVFTVYAIIIELLSLLTSKFNVEIKNVKARLAIIIVDILLIIFLFLPNTATKDVFLKVFFKTDEYVDFNSYTTNIAFYERFGLINGMYGVVLNNTFTEPKDYDENVLNGLLNNVEKNTNSKNGKPNIIVVFSESFWDVDQLTELKFNQKVTTNFNKLKEEGEFVNLVSPTYGGMSENVAFEFVTGGSMNYFPLGYIPIMSLYSNEASTNIPSIIRVLKDNGYESEIVFGKDYYNSEEAYTKIGFDKYSELVYGGLTWVTDEYSTNAIIRRLENKNKDEKLFLMLETIECHMPFNADKYEKYDVLIEESELDNSMINTLTSYSQGIYNADKQLGRLYEYLKTYEEPTILIFLGDHLPYLYTKNNKNVIDELQYFNTEDAVLNDFRKYNTQALVLSNYDMEIDIPDYMGVDLLLNHIVNQLEIENQPYYKWLYNTVDDLAGSNKYISFDKDGKIYNTSELTGTMHEMFKTKEKMQYKFFMSQSN